MPLQEVQLSFVLKQKMSRPYDSINAAQLQHDADECLLSYGTDFHPEIITSADGIHIETASGHRMMDVSCTLIYFPSTSTNAISVHKWANVYADRSWPP